jgi:hypothetical protein
MPTLTEYDFRQRHLEDLAPVPPALVEKALRVGLREVRSLVAAETLTVWTAAADPQNDPQETVDLRDALSDAQDNFAYAELLPELASRIKDGRLLQSARDETALATHSYFKFADIEGAIENYRRRALAALAGYIVIATEEADGIAPDYSQNIEVEFVW